LRSKLGKLTVPAPDDYTMKLCLVCNFQFGDEQEICPKDSSKLVPLGKDQLLGKVIQDRYRIENVIAKGSMGVVYRATQELIGREVAVKVLHAYLVTDEESLKRFQLEAKAASRLNHPNITTLYDYGVLSTGQPYIVMDLLRGSTLGDILKERDYLPVDEALVIFRQVCDALAEAHKRGVVHRDMKPDNIVLEYTARGVNVKVVDFGIAKFLQQQDDTIGKITRTGTVCGSPTYMSPEQCDDNNVDHRSDIYSLGVVFYETITGKVPFSSGDIYQVMTMHVKEPPPRLQQMRPDVTYPPYIEAVLDKALAKKPEARYQSVEEFWDALQGKGASVGFGDPSRTTVQNPGRGGGQVSVETPKITEEEVKSVVARALQKRMQAEGATADADPQMPPPIDAETIRRRATQSGLNKPDSQVSVRFSRGTPGLLSRVFAALEHFFPVVITIALFGSLYWLVTNESLVHSVIDEKIKPMLGVPKPQPQVAENELDTNVLIAQGKYDQAKTILEKRKKDAKLSSSEVEELDTVYERLARKEIKSKHFKQAVALLQQISPDGQDEGIRNLIKKYRKAK
jgi:serine/threonine protein kinase